MNYSKESTFVNLAAQVDFCLFLNGFRLACNTAPENWHMCVNKGLIYLPKPIGKTVRSI